MILDTCALIFLANGDPRLSESTRALLARQRHRWFCAISGFEIALKCQQGKLELPSRPARWLEQLVALEWTLFFSSQELCLAGIPTDCKLPMNIDGIHRWEMRKGNHEMLPMPSRKRAETVTHSSQFLQGRQRLTLSNRQEWKAPTFYPTDPYPFR